MTTQTNERETAPEPAADSAEPQAETAALPAAAPDDGADEEEWRGPAEPDGSIDRFAIARKFDRRRRDADEPIGFRGADTDPTTLRSGRLTQELPDEPAAQAQPGAQAGTAEDAAPDGEGTAPKTHRLVVRREEREVDEDELHRLAQIGAAGESYLADARRILDEATALRNAAVPRPHPDAVDSAQPNALDDAEQTPHPADDPLVSIVEKIQFGDPKEGAAALREALAGTHDTDAARAVYDHHRRLDLGRAQTALESFRSRNADLLTDPMTETVMEKLYYDGLRQDLGKLGVPTDAIPTDTARLVETHRFHRIHGQPVRDTAALLEGAKDAFIRWKGSEQAPTARQGEPQRVAVTVDRAERRRAIPQQPARAAVPASSETRAAPQASTRSEAVRKMMARRGQLVVT